MWIFDRVLMSKISWDFLIHDMTVSFVEDLAATQTRMFKKWINYSGSGNVTVFYRSKTNFGWNTKERNGYVLPETAVDKMQYAEML